MTYRGRVKNGVVTLDNGARLPDGAEVLVELVPERSTATSAKEAPTLHDSLAQFVGKAEGLPPDLSVNLDHYLYGTPKRE